MPTLCRLCQLPNELRKSHIIPEFLYRPGYDEKGRLKELVVSTGRKKYLQKGFRERLLCDGCEDTIGKYEKYFADFWYQTDPIPDPVVDDALSLSIRYPEFKLFLLSILWRSSISTLEPFEAVALGPFEDEVRRMLLDGSPGPDTRFQIFGVVYLTPSTRKPCHDVIMPPRRARGPRGTIAYQFIFGAVGWFFLVSNRTDSSIKSGALSCDGRMAFPVEDLVSDAPLTKMFVDHQLNARARAK